MARKARLHVPGGIFHVVSRFVRDERWLDRAGARDAYRALVQRAAEGSDTQILAYCLMSNHVHLVLLQGDAPISRFMKSVHTGFAAWVRAHSRARHSQGPIFAGRPRSILVDRNTYLLQLVRYVHNNPVRARVVRSAGDCDWSSHASYIGRDTAPAWLRTDHVLGQFGKDRRRAAQRFDAFVAEGRDEARRPELSGAADAGEAASVRAALGDGHRVSDGILGPRSLLDALTVAPSRDRLSRRGTAQRRGAIGRPTAREVVDAVLQLLALDPVDIEERPRARASVRARRLATWVWVHQYEGTQIEMSRELGESTAVISYHYGRAMRSAAEHDELASAVVAILDQRRPRPRAKTKASEGGHRVRYLVDVDET